MANDKNTWVVTGASSGLGKSISLEALKAGHNVIGTTRDISKAEATHHEFSLRGGIWLKLDPSSEDAYDQFTRCFQKYGVDVLVNNAGYAFIGGIEDTSEEELRDQMEVNFYGPLRAVRACLPFMRAKGSGQIILMSSGAGFIARPGRGAYSASKFAIEAIHESLSQEVANFGIKVLIVEPGAFRTPFSSRIITPRRFEVGFSDAYRGTLVEEMVARSRNITDIPEQFRGDPDKAAREVLKAAYSDRNYLRLPLGNDCLAALELKLVALLGDLEATRPQATATDID